MKSCVSSAHLNVRSLAAWDRKSLSVISLNLKTKLNSLMKTVMKYVPLFHQPVHSPRGYTCPKINKMLWYYMVVCHVILFIYFCIMAWKQNWNSVCCPSAEPGLVSEVYSHFWTMNIFSVHGAVCSAFTLSNFSTSFAGHGFMASWLHIVEGGKTLLSLSQL